MSRTSTICLLSGALAVLALPANSASAGHLTIRTSKVTGHTPAPPKLNSSTIAEYRNGVQHTTPRKLPGRTRFDPITLNRGVTSDRGFQQWKQGIGGTK
jgi:T4-like virus tail tube protein gp19